MDSWGLHGCWWNSFFWWLPITCRINTRFCNRTSEVLPWPGFPVHLDTSLQPLLSHTCEFSLPRMFYLAGAYSFFWGYHKCSIFSADFPPFDHLQPPNPPLGGMITPQVLSLLCRGFLHWVMASSGQGLGLLHHYVLLQRLTQNPAQERWAVDCSCWDSVAKTHSERTKVFSLLKLVCHPKRWPPRGLLIISGCHSKDVSFFQFFSERRSARNKRRAWNLKYT